MELGNQNTYRKYPLGGWEFTKDGNYVILPESLIIDFELDVVGYGFLEESSYDYGAYPDPTQLLSIELFHDRSCEFTFNYFTTVMMEVDMFTITIPSDIELFPYTVFFGGESSRLNLVKPRYSGVITFGPGIKDFRELEEGLYTCTSGDILSSRSTRVAHPVRSISCGDNRTYAETVVFEEGMGAKLTFSPSANTIVIDAIPGRGEVECENFVGIIGFNGVTPDEQGNINIIGKSGIRVYPEGDHTLIIDTSFEGTPLTQKRLECLPKQEEE